MPLPRMIARFNRDTANRRQLRVAGRSGARMSLLHHRGRRSGAAYVTPVGATRTAGGFVVPLPYGAGADWVRNVIAAGRGRLQWEGVMWDVGHPRIVPLAEAPPELPAGALRLLRLLRVDEVLTLVAHPSPPGGAPT